MATKFSFPKDQRFACRDCPARCCRVPWSIRFSAEETERYLAEPWVRGRVGEAGLRVLKSGVLPMREHERRLQCVFLDEDDLCGMQRQFGHGYIPRSCQAFPFGFLRDEKGAAVAQLSHLCPSIRDSYGEPVDKQLPAKLKQRGEVERMSTAMSTLGRVLLTQTQYLAAARVIRGALRQPVSPAESLAHVYDRLVAFERALPEGRERVSKAEVDEALAGTRGLLPEPLEPSARPSFHARALYSYLLGNLCWPSRLREDHRVGPAPALLGLRSMGNKLAWLRLRGRVDLLFLPAPIALHKVRRIPPFLAAEGEPAALVREHLVRLIDRRGLFSQPRYLLEVVVDLCLATVLMSRFARCSALAHERREVAAADVREAISVAELVLTRHVLLEEQGQTMKNLRAIMVGDRDHLRQLLAGEA